MTSPLLPETKLDAVNQMLASIGQAPVNSLDVAGIRDVAIAELALDTELRKVLTKPWSFNSDYDYPLSPDGNKNILIPSTAVKVDPVNTRDDYVMRWNTGSFMLYDRCKRTFEFEESVDCNITWLYEFEQIPQHARGYVSTKAARIFQSQVIGSPILYEYTAAHETEARATFLTIERQIDDTSILDPRIPTVATIFNRRTNPTR